MNDNFETQLEDLQKQINKLKNQAEDFQKSNPEHAVINARRACEAICEHICLKKGLIRNRKISLYDMIQLINQNSLVPRHLLVDIRFIQQKGNTVAHSCDTINSEDAKPVLNALSNLVNWYFSGTTSQNEGDEDQGASPKTTTETEQGTVIDTIAETYKKPWFKTGAAAIMAATAAALAGKILKK